MARPAPFRQADLSRALKAAAAAGFPVGRFEIDPTTGKIVVERARPADASRPANEPDEWADTLE